MSWCYWARGVTVTINAFIVCQALFQVPLPVVKYTHSLTDMEGRVQNQFHWINIKVSAGPHALERLWGQSVY